MDGECLDFNFVVGRCEFCMEGMAVMVVVGFYFRRLVVSPWFDL